MPRRSLLACAALSLSVWACAAEPAPAHQNSSPPPVSADVSAEALRTAVQDGRLRAFYEARGWRPVWDGRRAETLWDILAGAERHGLDPARFTGLVGGDAGAAEREIGLTRAALAYAEALSAGIVDPAKLHDIYTLDRNQVDVASGLGGALEGGSLEDWYGGLAPQDREYAALSEAYQRELRAARGQSRARVDEEGPLIRAGDADSRVPAVAAALRAEGFLAAQAPQAPPSPSEEGGGGPEPSENLYTEAMAEGVRRLQEAYGLRVDGVVGPNTIRALNVGPMHRAQLLALNLERRRWLERQPSPTRIDVNVAAAVLHYYRDGQVERREVVVVGEPDNQTPALQSPIYRLVANPPWTVPKSIAQEEILPKGRAYMRRNNMVMRDGWVVQQPGPDSALGLVKFDMINDHAIYLHDTPAKALFDQPDRHRSHGCVRVRDAVGFARLLAEHDGKLAEFERAMATGEETPVELSERIPVRLLYHTAYVEDGQVVFRPDAYGRDAALARAMGLDVSRGPLSESGGATDVGP